MRDTVRQGISWRLAPRSRTFERVRTSGLARLIVGCVIAASGCNVGLTPPTTDDPGTTGVLDAATSDADAAADAPGATCLLLQASCINNQACYPYPFESNNPTTTRCAFPGTGDVAVPCQSQLECDSSSICSNPGDPSSVCLSRCDLSLPFCFSGSDCIALPAFPGVGACTL
jgi:hypothetical protein